MPTDRRPRLLIHCLTVLLVLLAAAIVAEPAGVAAKRENRFSTQRRVWCRVDPIFRVHGTEVNVDVAVQDIDVAKVNGPFSVTFYVPVGSKAKTEIVFIDQAGFGGHGETVDVREDPKLKASSNSIPIEARVTLKATSSIPVMVFVTPAKGKATQSTGKANREFRVRTTVSPST